METIGWFRFRLAGRKKKPITIMKSDKWRERNLAHAPNCINLFKQMMWVLDHQIWTRQNVNKKCSLIFSSSARISLTIGSRWCHRKIVCGGSLVLEARHRSFDDSNERLSIVLTVLKEKNQLMSINQLIWELKHN